MSTDDKNKLPIAVPVIERNEIKKSFSTFKFGKRSKDRAEQPFVAPDISEPRVETFKREDGSEVKALTGIDDLLWVGVHDAMLMLKGVIRRTFMDLWIEAIDEDGKFNESLFLARAAIFTEGAESLSDIYDRIDELQDQQQAIIANPLFGSSEDTNEPKLTEQIKLLGAEIKPLKERAAAREAVYAERAAKAKATKEAKKEEAPKEAVTA